VLRPRLVAPEPVIVTESFSKNVTAGEGELAGKLE
jgi:hypothetical protein